MPVKRLEVVVRRQSGVAIIDLRGEINAFAEEVLDAAYSEAAETDSDVMLLNFSGVDYINSTGIALIVSLLSRSNATQKQLGAYGLNDHYREIFAITRLTDFMPMYADEQSALTSLTSGVAPGNTSDSG
jgi:anti-anti-sigma factor